MLMDPPYSRSVPLPPMSPSIRAWVREYESGPLSRAQLEQFYEWGYVLGDPRIPPALHLVLAWDELTQELQAA